jgi:hypothetical protein
MSEKPQDPAPFAHSLTDKDETTRGFVTTYFKTILMSTLLITVAIWGILPIYWVRAPCLEDRSRHVMETDAPSVRVLHRVRCGAPHMACTT